MVCWPYRLGKKRPLQHAMVARNVGAWAERPRRYSASAGTLTPCLGGSLKLGIIILLTFFGLRRLKIIENPSFRGEFPAPNTETPGRA